MPQLTVTEMELIDKVIPVQQGSATDALHEVNRRRTLKDVMQHRSSEALEGQNKRNSFNFV